MLRKIQFETYFIHTIFPCPAADTFPFKFKDHLLKPKEGNIFEETPKYGAEIFCLYCDMS